MSSERTDKGPGHQVIASVVDILDRPTGARQRQLLFGDPVHVLDREGEFLRVRALRDGYTGFVPEARLGAFTRATHRVISLATHLYAAADLKSPDLASLSFGAHLTIVDQTGDFWRTHQGYFVPKQHLVEVHRKFADPVAIAEMFLGTPYLWGGNSRLGIDCSGLVQASCLACGVACAGDSHDQEGSLGRIVEDSEPLRRGDILFWKGHVAMMVSGDRMIHANAHQMATTFEPVHDAVKRIAAQGGGQITRRRRLDI